MVHAFFNPAQAATFNKMAPCKGSTFEVHYFGIHGPAATTRAILAISGADFKNVVPEDWVAVKTKTPFGVVPILKEISVDGKEIQIAETDAIERYLARKFGLLGRDAFEETVINTFISSTSMIAGPVLAKYFAAQDPESKAEIKAKIFKDSVQPWIAYHEQHLADNGSNGHYVGTTFSLADLQTAFLVKMVVGLWSDVISEGKNPALWKVKTNLEANAGYAAWTQTDSFKALDAMSKQLIGF
ncbi:hypothetical protein CPC16_010743 [Podila verticillata]|nr:hypothetical protein CPC16_010743 [Podila verticillata]